MDRQLIEYLPEFLKEFEEFQKITGAEQPEIGAIGSSLQDALKDQFVLDATEHGVRRWEKILGVAPKATATLEERRFLILARLSEKLPYTIRMLMQQLESLCGRDGFTVEMKNDEYLLLVRIALTARRNYDDVESILRRIIPANIVVDLSLLYNQHKTLRPYTYRQLAVYTHAQLRNEVVLNGE